jgi:hypothetical protein
MPLNQAREFLTGAASTLLQALASPNSRTRPQSTTWSRLEYACHVRDTCDIFRGRIVLVLEQDDPTFPNWDQDVTAVELRYDQQDPPTVGTELLQALDALLQQVDAIPQHAWERPALRSNGSRFTLASLVRYLVHDPIHHAHDVALTAPKTISRASARRKLSLVGRPPGFVPGTFGVQQSEFAQLCIGHALHPGAVSFELLKLGGHPCVAATKTGPVMLGPKRGLIRGNLLTDPLAQFDVHAADLTQTTAAASVAMSR